MADGEDNRRLPVDQAVSLVEKPRGRTRLEEGLQHTAELSHAADFANVSLGRLPIHGERQIGFGPVGELNLGDNVMAFLQRRVFPTLVVGPSCDLGADEIGEVAR